jgi:pyrroloquinoline quinone (PQQ) biosynthesis protein C
LLGRLLFLALALCRWLWLRGLNLWIDARGLEYFRSRLIQARRDSGEALELTVKYCHTRELQNAALNALRFKCELLWSILDSIYLTTFAARHQPKAGRERVADTHES